MGLVFSYTTDYLSAIEDDFTLDNTSPYEVFPLISRLRAINLAREDIAREAKCIRARMIATATVGQSKYTVAEHSTFMFHVSQITYGTKALKFSEYEDDLVFGRHLTENGEPEYYTIDPEHSYFYLTPPPQTASKMYVYGYNLPSILNTSVSATPATYSYSTEYEIPHRYRHLVPEFALMRGFRRDGQTEGLARAQYHENVYKSALTRAIAAQKQDRLPNKVKFTLANSKKRETSGYD